MLRRGERVCSLPPPYYTSNTLLSATDRRQIAAELLVPSKNVFSLTWQPALEGKTAPQGQPVLP